MYIVYTRMCIHIQGGGGGLKRIGGPGANSITANICISPHTLLLQKQKAMSKNKDLDPYWVDYVARWERVIGRDGKVMYRFKGCTEPVHALDDPTLPTPLPN